VVYSHVSARSSPGKRRLVHVALGGPVGEAASSLVASAASLANVLASSGATASSSAAPSALSPRQRASRPRLGGLGSGAGGSGGGAFHDVLLEDSEDEDDAERALGVRHERSGHKMRRYAKNLGRVCGELLTGACQQRGAAARKAQIPNEM